MSHPLPLTGERTLPHVRGEEYWFARHEAAYRWVASGLAAQLQGAVVVEAGSGEGYGADILRQEQPRLVAALEYDAACITHIARTYADVAGVQANLAELPIRSGAADVVITLQVIEHLWDLRGFLGDSRRTLRPGGLLVASTPHRPVFSPGVGRGERPLNPFHVEEFDVDQLRDLLADSGFTDVQVHGLHHGERIKAWEDIHGDLVRHQIEGLELEEGSESLDQFVATVTYADFVVGSPDDAQDLLVVAYAP